MSLLPSPQLTRWQPLRLGLRNIYRYDREEFHFSGGRLLLRGNNGTGKTRVLALTLPFLLDGEVSPARVEPDGNRNRRIEWHLLLDTYSERTGYTWMEFGRRDGDSERFCTIGCGMRAVQGHQGLRSRWFFVTHLRVGAGLELATAEGLPLGKEQLREVLGSEGTLFETAASYRQSVDEHLFALGEHRYRALVDLLIELRRPQLSRELDEARVSTALSQALAPVASAVLDVVAESYRALERERDELLSMERAASAVAAFNLVQARAVQVHAAALSDRVVSANTRYEDAQQALRLAVELHQRAEQDLAAAQRQLEECELGLAAAAGEANALESSDTMRSATHLARLTEEADRARSGARYAAISLAAAQTQLNRRQARHTEALRLEGAAHAAGEQAAAGALTLLATLGIDLAPDARQPAAMLEMVLETLGTQLPERQRAASALALAEHRLQEQERSLAAARERVAHAESQRDRSQAQAEVAATELNQHAAAALVGTRAHLRTLRVLGVPSAVVEAMEEWVREPTDQAPYGLGLAAAADAVRGTWAEERGGLSSERTALIRRQEPLRAEAAQLEAGRDPGPAAPAWRDGAVRSGRPGAPLWRLCEFQERLAATERAALEGALQGAGLLDAWVHPGGRLEWVDGDSCLLSTEPLPDGASLAGALLPAIDPADDQASRVAVATVSAILSGIRLFAAAEPAVVSPSSAARAPLALGTLWIALDGRWGSGALQGQWRKPEAEHLGAGARAATRRRRLAAVRLELEGIDLELARIVAAVAAGEARLQQVAMELDSQPDTAALVRSWDHNRQRLEWLAEARAEVAARQAVAAGAMEAVGLSHVGRQRLAEDCRLVPWIGREAELREALHHAELGLRDLRSLVESTRQAGLAVSDAGSEVELASTAHRQADESYAERSIRAATATAEAQTLQDTLGTSVAELYRTLQAVRERSRILTERRSAAEQACRAAQGEIGRTSEAERQDRDRLGELSEQRAEALQDLLVLSQEGLLAGLGADYAALPAGASDTRVLELARQLRKEAGTITRDAATADRLQAQVGTAAQQLHAELSSCDLRPMSEIRHRLMIVRVPFQGADRTAVELEGLLRADAASRQLLLSAREREVIETFLIDEAANELHHLLHRAEAWQVRVNQELHERPMSTGMALRFQWLPAEDGPEGIEAARERLLRPNHLWSPEDRTALAEFLQRRIQAAREEVDDGTWQEQLALALDYRRWHRFVIERRQDGRWLRLTNRTHGTGSGGEKAVSLTMPQFAAAAAHYHAAPLAPRLILLDEAFVGIDGDMRRKCLGLLSAFDLDVVMTSEREWGCYDTVPALSIYQLAAAEGGGCVTATRYVWDGTQRRRVDDASP